MLSVIGGRVREEGVHVGSADVAEALRSWVPVTTSRPSPERFAQASANTRFGGIDVFVLRRTGATWYFDDRVEFNPDSFRGPEFDVVDDLPSGLVLAVRTS